MLPKYSQRPMTVFVALVLCLLHCANSRSYAEEAATTPTKEISGYSSSMTVVPPVPVSEKVKAEVRVAVRNLTLAKRAFNLEISIKTASDEVRTLVNTKLEVDMLGQELFTHHFPTSGLAGENSIAYRLTDSEGNVQSGNWPLTVVSCESRAVPLLQIGWIEPGAIGPGVYQQRKVPTEQDLRDAIDRYNQIGMKSLIIAYSESIYTNAGTFYPSQVFEEKSKIDFDVVGTILNQASKNGQHVFVGLGRGADLWLTWTGFDDPKRIQASLAHSMKLATELWARYHHEPSFYGWYLAHEANDIAQASKAYYNPMTRFLRTFEADKPVLASPSGTPILPPEALDESEVDILAYQDAVGSGYIPFENTFDPQRRIATLDGVYASYAKAHRESDIHLWTNLEIWQMDGPEYSNAYPPGFDRVKQQLEIEKQYVDVMTTYCVLGFMDSSDSSVELGGPRAVQLYESYHDYVLGVEKKLQLNVTGR